MHTGVRHPELVKAQASREQAAMAQVRLPRYRAGRAALESTPLTFQAVVEGVSRLARLLVAGVVWETMVVYSARPEVIKAVD